MEIISEAVQLVKEKLGSEFDDLTIERLVVGLFFTGIKLSNGYGGVCFTPVKEIPEAVCCPSSAGKVFDPVKIRGIKVSEILSKLTSKEPIKIAVAIATLNALSVSCWEQGITGNYTIRKNIDAQDAVRIREKETVAVIGAIVPALRMLKRRGGTWWVIEKDSRTLKPDEISHYIPAERSVEIIENSDVLIVTGATLVTHTLEKILAEAKPEAEIAVIGPTAGFVPEPLFKRGVRIVGGVWVKKPDELLDILAAGGSGYHFFDTLADRIVIEKSS